MTKLFRELQHYRDQPVCLLFKNDQDDFHIETMSLKNRIIEESLKLFSLKGFNNTSLKDILSVTDASKGGFYNHFKSKDDLFFHVLEKARQIWREKNLSGLDEINSPVAKLEKLLQNYGEKYLKDRSATPGGCVFITLSVELNDQSPKLFSEIDRGFVGLKKLIKHHLDEGKNRHELIATTDIDMVTEVLFNGMLGASVCFGAHKSEQDLDRSIQALTNFLASYKNR